MTTARVVLIRSISTAVKGPDGTASHRRAGFLHIALPTLPLFLSLLSPGCGRYADFTLPPPGGDLTPVEFRWETLPDPVLGPGEPGAWDSVDVLNPSLVRQNGSWLNFYSGFDGTSWHTGLAVSEDGKNWEKEIQNKNISPE